MPEATFPSGIAVPSNVYGRLFSPLEANLNAVLEDLGAAGEDLVDQLQHGISRYGLSIESLCLEQPHRGQQQGIITLCDGFGCLLLCDEKAQEPRNALRQELERALTPDVDAEVIVGVLRSGLEQYFQDHLDRDNLVMHTQVGIGEYVIFRDHQRAALCAQLGQDVPSQFNS